MQVQQLAKELNYEPNQKAIFFKQGKTFTIGVILPNLREEYFSIAISGIEDVAIKNRYNVIISQSHDNPEREKQIVDTMRKSRVDGIVVSIAKNTINFDHFLQLENFNIPVVFFDRVPAMEKAYSVSSSLKKSTISMIDMLVKKGHKRIGFIKGPDSIESSKERLEGFFEGLKKNGIKQEKELIIQCDLTTAGTESAIGRMLALQQPPTAVITFNDYVALDAIRYARKRGLKINEDIFFVSYANLPITYYLDNPPFASVEQYPYEQAEKAMLMLLKLMSGKNGSVVTPRQVVLESKLVLHED